MENEEENYYKPIRVGYFRTDNYNEYETNGDKNKTLSTEEYLNKYTPYLNNIINNLENSDAWRVQLEKIINFISSKDTDKESLMHSKTDNIKLMINHTGDEVIEEKEILPFFQSYHL